ncbi:MAG: site-2 protease family protein [Planctomycetaceae bacterium]
MATITAACVLAVSLSNIQNILIVALGLGLVIFFHELGHFAVAKWCNVNVERFSIGFGPILFSWKWGETEYALSLIPFGGYVKMLGQDDADPAQMTSVEVEQDPRSYIAKNVPQRMAIISAGVIMNIITGLLFFAFAFGVGVKVPPSELGTVFVGKPAWKAGIQEGDRLTRINGRDISSFGDIIRATALSSSDVLEVDGIRYTGETFSAQIYPEMNGTRREIGVGPISSLELASGPDVKDNRVTVLGSPADAATPPFAPADLITAIDGKELSGFADLQNTLARKRSQEVTFHVLRKTGPKSAQDLEIRVGPQTFRTLGLWMDIGPIEAVQEDSPASRAGLKPGDKIVRIENLDVGKDLNPLTLPEFFADRHGQNVKILVTRESPGTGDKQHELEMTPEDRPGWVERPSMRNSPLSVPAIGVAFHLIPTVLKVEEGSQAEGKIQAGDHITQVQLYQPEGQKLDDFAADNDKLRIPLDETNRNWAHAFWLMQAASNRHARLTILRNGKETKTLELEPQRATDWYLPTRGIQMTLLSEKQKAETTAGALAMGINHTRNSIIDIYLTLKNLITQKLSVKELHGPIGIARVAYQVSQQGLADLSLFLGFLSVNLAVLNFLPIPLLAGGHMVFLLWEGITRRKPSEKVLIAATYAGMAFVLSLMVLVIFLDIFVHGFGR